MTPRQAEILDLVAEGLGDKEIAQRLGISTNTVRTHLQRVYRDQQVPNRAAAASIRVGGRVPPPGSWDLSRPAILIGTLMAVALLVVGGSHVFRLASAVLPRPASTPAAGRPSPMPSNPAAGPATATPPPALRASPAAQPASPAAEGSAAIPALPNPAPGPLGPTPDPAHEELVIVNQHRELAGLSPLAWNDCLGKVAAGDAAKVASLGSLSPPGGEAADIACAPGQAVEIVTFWSSVDDGAVSRNLFANPSWQAALLGAHRLFAAAWAPGAGGAYLVLEIV